MVFEEPSPTHTVTSNESIAWTTGNIGEALPGVTTPLTWTFYQASVEPALRRGFHRLGALRAAELEPRGLADVFHAPFFGRAALNLDFMGEMANRMPGGSASELETQLLGTVRDTTSAENSYSRYPAIALRTPWEAVRAARRSAAGRVRAIGWHGFALARLDVQPTEDLCRELLQDSVDQIRVVMTDHLLATMLATPLFETVASLASRAGLPGAEARLLSGLNTVEVTVADDLWALAHGELTEVEFLRRHGHLGPGGVHVSDSSWRQDPRPLRATVSRYGSITDWERPRDAMIIRAADRRDAERDVVRALPARSRPAARGLIRLAAHVVPLREVGRDSWTRLVDGARAITCQLGQHLWERGMLGEPDDIAFCSLHELLSGGAASPEVVRRRREDWASFHALTLPLFWEGTPTPVAEGAPRRRTQIHEIVRGVAIGGGAVEGNARVVHHPGVDEFEPGEILVCPHTDPGWVSLFLQAAAVVVDKGGAASHGAIVARELGIPAVTGTRDGTARIWSGARIRVDADAGTVTVLEQRAMDE